MAKEMAMAEAFEFELVFGIPEDAFDPYLLSDAVFAAGFEDALVGTGIPGLLAVEIEVEGGDGEQAILDAARRLLATLPKGSRLREVRPDLVSLADVAERLSVTRQSLQQRRMPPPTQGGLYRIDEVARVLADAMQPVEGRRRPRLNVERAANWLRAGPPARRINARLALNEIDPQTVEPVGERGVRASSTRHQGAS